MRYLYRCPECGAEREVNHGMNKRKIVFCHECRDVCFENSSECEEYLRSKNQIGPMMHRVISGGNGVLFKGDGWEGGKVGR